MAEVAATAVGIAGVVSVLQSLLQCYRDFLTARNFEGDYAHLQLRAALLENSTTTWAIAVGLINDSGVPCNKFLVAQPTEYRAGLVKATLGLIRDQLNATNSELASYTSNTPISLDMSNAEDHPSLPLVSNGQNDKPSKAKRIAHKLHLVCKPYSKQCPGILKQTVWALVDKARLEAGLNKVTMLVDRLNTDFAPINQKQQLNKYCQNIKNLEMSEEDLRIIEEVPSDQFSQGVMEMLDKERSTGNRFIRMTVTKEGSVNIGDHYDKDWKGPSAARRQARSNTYESLSITDTAFVNIGDNFGGKSPVQIRLEQLQAAKQNKSRDFPDGKPPF